MKKAQVIWMTGLSGAGKTTLANKLFESLKSQGQAVELLDGDAIRQMFPATGFSKADRDQHVRRVGFVASLLEKHNVTVIGSLISPYRESRDFIRGLCQNFVEVYLSTPLSVCESRDPKGLYRKARRGEIKNFTGVDDPYEAPTRPELVLDTSLLTVDECVSRILEMRSK